MKDEIMTNAEYCLKCINKPCSLKGCPLNNKIPEFIELVKKQDYKKAYEVLSETTVLPGVCGRVCPQKKQCEGSCIRGIKDNPVEIGKIESFIFDKAIENNYRLKDFINKAGKNNNSKINNKTIENNNRLKDSINKSENNEKYIIKSNNNFEILESDNNIKIIMNNTKKLKKSNFNFENSYKFENLEKSNNVAENEKIAKIDNVTKKEKSKSKKIAIVGGGPAGLSCAAFLAKENVYVTIYEKYDYLGGLLLHGIPEFRLPRYIVKESIDRILELGINVKYNQTLGENLSIEEIEKNYDAIFLAIGANKPIKMGIEGENLEGVFGGNSLLEYDLHPDYKGKVISVIGGGNVAIDCARTIARKGAKKVNIIYRRDEEQMPAEIKEIENAKKDGINFIFKTNVLKILGQSKVEKLELIKTDLVQKEGERRPIPINIENSNFQINCDYVITALGSTTDDIVKNLNLKLDKYNNIEVDENYQTSNFKIYAGGDLIGGNKTIASACRTGIDAAKKIINNL